VRGSAAGAPTRGPGSAWTRSPPGACTARLRAGVHSRSRPPQPGQASRPARSIRLAVYASTTKITSGPLAPLRCVSTPEDSPGSQDELVLRHMADAGRDSPLRTRIGSAAPRRSIRRP
jgi:hypothetical protein